jgi:hypothetical protein
MTTDPSTLAVLAPFLPSTPVLTKAFLGIEMARQVLHTLAFTAIMMAVFSLFLVTSLLTDALWDRPKPVATVGEFVYILGVGGTASLYVVLVSGLLFVNLASIQNFTALAVLVHHSLLEHWLAWTVTWLHAN